MADSISMDKKATDDEIKRLLRNAQPALKPYADKVVETAQRLAPRRTGRGAASIHAEYGDWGDGPEYRVSYDGDQRSYMGLVEVGTRKMTPRPYLRPAIESYS